MPGSCRAARTRAKVTLAVHWSVNKEASGTSTALSVGDMAVPRRRNRESTPMSSRCYIGSSNRLEVSIICVITIYVMRYVTCKVMRYFVYFDRPSQ